MSDRDPQDPQPSERPATRPIGNAMLPHLPVIGAALLVSACTITLPDGQVVALTQLLGPQPQATPSRPFPPGSNGFPPPPSPKVSPIVNRLAPTPAGSPTPDASSTPITSINRVLPAASSTVTPSPSPTARFPFLNGMLPAKPDAAVEPASSESLPT